MLKRYLIALFFIIVMPRHLKWRLSIFNVSALFLVGCYEVLLTIAHFFV
jgi:hypothetical protein